MKKTKERRAQPRKRVIFGAKAGTPGSLAALDCVVRNFTDSGACVELKDPHRLPDDIALSISRKGRNYAARVVWSHENAAGVAFLGQSPSIVPDRESDLQARLRISERKARVLRNRVKELSGEG